jgi:hypothetical protein
VFPIRSARSVIFFGVINIGYLAVYFALGPSTISFLLTMAGVALLSPLWPKPAVAFASNILFRGSPVDIAQDSHRRRFTVEDISAFVGLAVYLVLVSAGKGIQALADGLFLLTLTNAVLLLPLILGQNLRRVVADVTTAVKAHGQYFADQ